MPDLSICIPTRQRAAYLERCLDALQPVLALPLDVEIVVSDNASTDGTAALCARAIQAGLPLRYLRQPCDVGAERNVASALRAATGTLCLYLGDDDRLIPERIAALVAAFDAAPELVCVQAPWQSRDDAGERDLGAFYQLDQPVAFGASDAWPCWQFLLQHAIFPEIAVYRTEALHRILHLPRTLHWAFVWCFRLLGHGTVAFSPTPFYVHVVRPAADLPPRRALGLDQATSHLDRYRGALEWALAAALRAVVGYVPLEKRELAARMLAGFLAERAAVAARVAAGDHDYIAATEHFSRSQVWEPGVDLAPLRQFEHEHASLAAVQAIGEVARSSAGVDRVWLCCTQGADALHRALGALPGEPLRVEVPPSPLPPAPDALILVDRPADRARFIQAGALPGRVLAWEEVADCYRIHDPIGAAARTARVA